MLLGTNAKCAMVYKRVLSGFRPSSPILGISCVAPFTWRALLSSQGDFNDANIVVTPDRQDVTGIIDFGDATHTWLVNDVAIAMAYAMLSPLAK